MVRGSRKGHARVRALGCLHQTRSASRVKSGAALAMGKGHLSASSSQSRTDAQGGQTDTAWA